MDKSAKKVGFWQHQRSGCWWYRIKHPMDLLQANGVETEMLQIDKDIEIDTFQSIQFYGAYPFSMEKVLKLLKEKGIKIVYDTDDALDLVEETNPFYHSVKKDVGSVKEVLAYADEVTVSTPEMEKYIKGMYEGKITVVPNCYLPSEWTFPKPQREGIRIGFSGASPHVSDLLEVIPVIKKLQDKYNVKFLIMGFGEQDYVTWYKQYRYIAQPEATRELRKLDNLLKDIVFEWVPFVDFSIYPQVLTNLALDIGICPLKDTPFNNHRSACKAMEYTLAGALALASDTIPYREDKNSILVPEGKWEEMLETTIKDLIENAGINNTSHLEWTKENRNLENQVDLLKSIYVV